MGLTPDIFVHSLDEYLFEGMPFATGPLYQLCGRILLETPHRHTFYEILYITEGDGTHFIDFEPYPLKPPAFYFISPGQVHLWQVRSTLQGRVLMFEEDFLVFPSSNISKTNEITFFHNVGEAPELHLTQDQAAKIDSLLKSIFQEYKSEGFSRASMLRAYIHILIIQLQRLHMIDHPKQNAINESELVRRFKRLVAAHYNTEHSIQTYADDLGVSISHLNNILKSMTGYSPGQLIRHEIAMEAKRLLVHTELSISEVGYRLRFEDPSYFGRFFKRETGMNPALFREQIREKYQLFPR